jgi:hypothetical protein
VQAAELADKKWLDAIEASTLRTYQHVRIPRRISSLPANRCVCTFQTLVLNEEVSQQNRKVDELEAQHIKTKDALRKETNSIVETRKAGQELWWMYVVIAVELIVMLFLLYVGLA